MSTSPIKAVRGARQLSVKEFDNEYAVVYAAAGGRSWSLLKPVVFHPTRKEANVAKAKFQAKENAKAQAKTAKAKAEKAAPAGKPIKSRLTKTALISQLETDSGVDAKSVKAVLAALEDAITRSIAPKGAGTFALPGMFIINTKKVKARKGGKIATSPFTGESYMTKDKPASIKVRVRVGTKLKQAASA